MAEKKLTLAVRLNANPPTIEDISVRTTLGQPVKYRLLSIPLYLSEFVGPLIDQTQS